MIYPDPCSDSNCTRAHKVHETAKLHRGSLYVQVLRTSSNSAHEVTVLSYKTIYYLTDAQKQKMESLIQERVLAPIAINQKQFLCSTSAIYFSMTRSRCAYDSIRQAAIAEEIAIVADGPIIDAANEEGANLLETIHKICSTELKRNPIKCS